MMPRFRHLLLAAAVCAALPALAAAQDPRDRGDQQQRDGRGDGRQGDGRDRRFDGDRAPQQQAPVPQAGTPGPGGAPDRGQPAQFDGRGGGRGYDARDRGAPAARPAPDGRYDGGRGYRDAGDRPDGAWRGPGGNGAGFRSAPGGGYDRGGYDRGGYDRGSGRRDDRAGGFRGDWRGDRRYDWRGYRDGHRQLFRAPRYVPPRGYGYGYRPFGIGMRLDRWLYASTYWISDPYAYRLPPANGPYRWVRYYDDVLLIDLRSGEVIDAIDGFFL